MAPITKGINIKRLKKTLTRFDGNYARTGRKLDISREWVKQLVWKYPELKQFRLKMGYPNTRMKISSPELRKYAIRHPKLWKDLVLQETISSLIEEGNPKEAGKALRLSPTQVKRRLKEIGGVETLQVRRGQISKISNSALKREARRNRPLAKKFALEETARDIHKTRSRAETAENLKISAKQVSLRLRPLGGFRAVTGEPKGAKPKRRYEALT